MLSFLRAALMVVSLHSNSTVTKKLSTVLQPSPSTPAVDKPSFLTICMGTRVHIISRTSLTCSRPNPSQQGLCPTTDIYPQTPMVCPPATFSPQYHGLYEAHLGTGHLLGRLWHWILEDQGSILLPYPKVTFSRNPTQAAVDILHLGTRWSKARGCLPLP